MWHKSFVGSKNIAKHVRLTEENEKMFWSFALLYHTSRNQDTDFVQRWEIFEGVFQCCNIDDLDVQVPALFRPHVLRPPLPRVRYLDLLATSFIIPGVCGGLSAGQGKSGEACVDIFPFSSGAKMALQLEHRTSPAIMILGRITNAT